MFGSQPPELRTVKVSPTEEVQVAWGLLDFPPLEAQFYLQERVDDDYGMAFQVFVMAKKKYEVDIRGLLMAVESYVRENSIYRNKALIGVGKISANGTYKEPEFYNPYEVDRTKVVYSQLVEEALTDQVWGVIENADLIRQSNRELGTHISLGNNVLMHGENGTGKTLGAAITAQYCLEHDWTFCQARWDEDLKHVLRFIEKLSTPSVVVIEDVENLFVNPQRMKEMLDLFDGMRNKGFEVMLLMTSNHVGELPKSMTGGHRIDHMIYVSDLDREGVEKLINVLIPEAQREELDYEELHTAYEGFSPSWIVNALQDVAKHSIIRTKKIGQALATSDFVRCAHALRPAWKMHGEATDKPERPDIETAAVALIGKALKESAYVNDDGDIVVNA